MREPGASIAFWASRKDIGGWISAEKSSEHVVLTRNQSPIEQEDVII